MVLRGGESEREGGRDAERESKCWWEREEGELQRGGERGVLFPDGGVRRQAVTHTQPGKTDWGRKGRK